MGATEIFKVPRNETNHFINFLKERKIEYKTNAKKGFLPLEVLEISITITEIAVSVLLAYLEFKKEPSEILIVTPEGELHLTAQNVRKLSLDLKKRESAGEK
jgi:hypothetical protein